MTYKELMNVIFQMTKEQRECDVTVEVHPDEFVPVKSLEISVESEIMDDDHPYLVV